jgi:hypothetical protein
MAGRIHNNKAGSTSYPIHADAINSAILPLTHTANGTWLLPMAYPEGAPYHPSFLAGHSSVSAGCVTFLKAWFDGSHVILSPVKPSSNGSSLVSYSGSPLTVEGELNKLSANVSMGRNFAGVHYRSDFDASTLLGEQVAISVLRDQRKTYGENFGGFTFKRFDGTTITI